MFETFDFEFAVIWVSYQGYRSHRYELNVLIKTRTNMTETPNNFLIIILYSHITKQARRSLKCVELAGKNKFFSGISVLFMKVWVEAPRQTVSIIPVSRVPVYKMEQSQGYIKGIVVLTVPKHFERRSSICSIDRLLILFSLFSSYISCILPDSQGLPSA